MKQPPSRPSSPAPETAARRAFSEERHKALQTDMSRLLHRFVVLDRDGPCSPGWARAEQWRLRLQDRRNFADATAEASTSARGIQSEKRRRCRHRKSCRKPGGRLEGWYVARSDASS